MTTIMNENGEVIEVIEDGEEIEEEQTEVEGGFEIPLAGKIVGGVVGGGILAAVVYGAKQLYKKATDPVGYYIDKAAKKSAREEKRRAKEDAKIEKYTSKVEAAIARKQEELIVVKTDPEVKTEETTTE